MPRPRYRVCLQDGQRLDINQLMRDGLMPRPVNGERGGTLRVAYADGFEQTIEFSSQRRRYGGRQYYFVCPVTSRLASVLYRPPGASRFCSRQAWRNVAYGTQFADPTDRAWLAKRKIQRRLSDKDWVDLLPPRPKHMRAATYAQWEGRWHEQEQKLDEALLRYLRSRWAHLEVFK